MDFIINNKEWIFSGIGVTVIILVWNFFFKKDNIKQTQIGGDEASMQQAGRDILNK